MRLSRWEICGYKLRKILYSRAIRCSLSSSQRFLQYECLRSSSKFFANVVKIVVDRKQSCFSGMKRSVSRMVGRNEVECRTSNRRPKCPILGRIEKLCQLKCTNSVYAYMFPAIGIHSSPVTTATSHFRDRKKLPYCITSNLVVAPVSASGSLFVS